MLNVKNLIGGGSKAALKPFYKMQRLCKSYSGIGLKNQDFTIISNNCTGGYVY